MAWKKKNLLLCYFAASTFAFKLKCTHISANKTAYKEFYWHILGGWWWWWCICCRLFPKEFIIEVFILSAITYAFHKFASFEVYPGEMNHIQQQEMKALFRSSTCEYHKNQITPLSTHECYAQHLAAKTILVDVNDALLITYLIDWI